MTAIYLTWQDPNTRRWYPVGRLDRDNGRYRFVYTKGAQRSSSFIPFGAMNRLPSTYISDELFPLFANRVMPKTRPEYPNLIRWLALEGQNPDPLALLARTGGLRLTDSLQMYPCPEKTWDGNYETFFFCHGLRYMAREVIESLSEKDNGVEIFPMLDFANKADGNAVALRTNSPVRMVGYCPRYLTNDIREVFQAMPSDFGATIVRVNSDAPVQFRLLIRVTAPWPAEFFPCSDEQFRPIGSLTATTAAAE